jgi:hypothetical protein
MKKILLTVAGSMLIGLAAVNAQERSDTTKRSDESTQYKTESGTQGQTSTIQGKSGTQGQYSWRESDRESITRDDLPQGLLTTLESDEYQGWENATIYRNKMSGDFMLVIQDNGETRTFYFDKEGSRTNMTDDQSGTTGDQTQTGVSGQTSTQTSGVSGQTSSQTDQSGVSVQTEGVSAEMYTEPEWKKSDKVKIRTSQIPNPMLITLGDPKYKGWDKGVVYKNKTTNDYMIEIKNGGETKVYYFDKEGQAKTSSSVSDDQSSYRSNDQSSGTGIQSTTSGAIGTSQVGDDKDSPEGETKENYSLNQGSVQDGSKMDAWKTEDRVMVTSSEIPVTLRTTLRDEKYKGWENSSIYRNRNTDEYMVEIRDGSSAKTYYFDKSGADITTSTYGSGKDDQDQNQTGSNQSDDRRSSYSNTDTGSTWKDEDRVIITTDQLPVSLRTTLSDDQYKGWETSSMYKNRSTNEYMVQIKDGSNVKTYYFDKDGKAITIESDDDDQ